MVSSATRLGSYETRLFFGTFKGLSWAGFIRELRQMRRGFGLFCDINAKCVMECAHSV